MKLRLLFIVLILAGLGCNKKEIPTKTTLEMLNSHTWYVQSFSQDGHNIGLPCLLDNYFIFSKDGTGYYDEGVAKCNSVDSQRYNYNYSLSADSKTLFISNVGPLLSHFDTSEQLDTVNKNLYWNIVKINDVYLEVTFKTGDSTHSHNYDFLFVND
ncbi:MAG TPA: hypothetical protein VN721_12665 [Flavipsychrobacter sp.]|nr:hypothetical protein [Flavipsychrobacter sp.]